LGRASAVGGGLGRRHRPQPEVRLLVRVQPPGLLLHRRGTKIGRHRRKLNEFYLIIVLYNY